MFQKILQRLSLLRQRSHQFRTNHWVAISPEKGPNKSFSGVAIAQVPLGRTWRLLHPKGQVAKIGPNLLLRRINRSWDEIMTILLRMMRMSMRMETSMSDEMLP